MRKRAGILCLSVILSIMLLSGCSFGPKPEETVTKFLDALKKFDVETMDSCVKDADWEKDADDFLNESEMKDFYANTLSKMTYSLEESKVDKDKATVPAKIKYFDGTELYGEVLGEYFAKAMGSALTGEEKTDEEYTRMLGEMLTEKTKDLDDKDTYTEVTIEFECEKVDGKWVISDVDDEMVSVLTSNFNKVGEELSDGLEDLAGAEDDADSSEAE